MHHRITTFILLFSAAWLWSASPIQPAGELRALQLTDLAPHPPLSKTYSEVWSYQLRLNGTIDLAINITRGNFGSFKEPVCGANVTLNNYNNTNYSVAREYPLHNFIWSADLAKLQVHHQIFFEGLPPQSHRLFFSTTKNGVSWELDLQFEQLQPSLIRGDGVWMIDNHKVGLATHFPWARVRGSLMVDGVQTEVSGTAMMDHIWQDDLAPAIIDRAYRWRLHSGADNWEVAYLLMPRSGGEVPAGYSLRKGDNGVELRTPTAVKIAESKTVGRVAHWPSMLMVEYGEQRDSVAFSPAWSRSSVLDEFSGVARWAVKKFLGGDLVNDRGGVSVNGRRGDYAHTFLRD